MKIRPFCLLSLFAALFISGAQACGSGPSASSSSPASASAAQQNSLLFLQTAAQGTYVAESSGTYLLTLRNGGPVLYIADRPARGSGSFTQEQFVQDWAGFGFNSSAPNAVLEVTGSDGNLVAAPVMLTNPSYNANDNTFTYVATPLGSFPFFYTTPERAGTLPSSFAMASLFIDNTGGDIQYYPVEFQIQVLGEGNPNAQLNIELQSNAAFSLNEWGNSSEVGLNLETTSPSLSSLLIEGNILRMVFNTSEASPGTYVLQTSIATTGVPILNGFIDMDPGLEVNLVSMGQSFSLSDGNFTVELGNPE